MMIIASKILYPQENHNTQQKRTEVNNRQSWWVKSNAIWYSLDIHTSEWAVLKIEPKSFDTGEIISR